MKISFTQYMDKFSVLGSLGAPAVTLYAGTYYSYTIDDNTGELYTIEPTTGAATFIGYIGYAVTGMSFHPITGVLYAVTANLSLTNPRSLITINPSTGVGTLIGPLGGASQPVIDIDFDSSGVLYGWSRDGDDLVTINLSTGARTVVGNSGLGSTSGGALAFDESNGLWFISNGVASTQRLKSVDPITGLVTNHNLFNGATGSGLAASAGTINFNDGLMYITTAAAGTAGLYTVDTSTSLITVVSSPFNNTYGDPAAGFGLAIDALAWKRA